MKITVDANMFARSFDDYGRGDQFSYTALDALFNYYDEAYEQDYELDVIEICCDWTEYEEDELITQYAYMLDMSEEEISDNFSYEEEIAEAIAVELNNHTIVITLDNSSYLVANF